ncbi:CPBP family intramembrane metalloprotease [Fructobacillus sp. M158]|uniref:CPBP family intramembrane glutamic endopeptidase n=1 Tax=Fructobacillus parabroussonetiae TaxID=2713174 RepID=UPI00200B2990|nr:CPBP family intramembrane glutamic endopeptidase [Fructobacillus parabroussonetiae]MCK8617876.1 CPBP family intramembrane metalloprotease [Fructobacillus parabroussonetiae]
MTEQTTFKKLITLTISFIVLDLVVQHIMVYQAVNWAFYQFNLDQFTAQFISKMTELIVVLGINAFVTKQKIYLKPRFTRLEALYWLFMVAVVIPFLSADNLLEAVGTGLMGGFPEEFLARAVLMGMFLTYLLKGGYRRHQLVKGILYADLAFALMHFTNLTHAPFSYVLVQSVLAFIAGLAYAAIYVQTGNIWSAVALHFVDDFVLTANAATGDLAMYANAAFSHFKIVLVIVLFLYWKKHEPELSRRIRHIND